MPHYVYLLECSDGTLYCGYTNDLKKRIEAHNSGKGARYTRGRLPVKLVYRQKLSSKGAALKRELRIKRLPRKQKLSLVRPKKNPEKLF